MPNTEQVEANPMGAWRQQFGEMIDQARLTQRVFIPQPVPQIIHEVGQRPIPQEVIHPGLTETGIGMTIANVRAVDRVQFRPTDTWQVTQVDTGPTTEAGPDMEPAGMWDDHPDTMPEWGEAMTAPAPAAEAAEEGEDNWAQHIRPAPAPQTGVLGGVTGAGGLPPHDHGITQEIQRRPRAHAVQMGNVGETTLHQAFGYSDGTLKKAGRSTNQRLDQMEEMLKTILEFVSKKEHTESFDF